MKKKTRFVLLGLLKEEQLTGYEIKKIIDGRMSFFWQESYGQIYPELNALLKEKFIREVVTSEKSVLRRERIKYTITDNGCLELKQWMESENEKDSTRSEFLLKIFLSTDKNHIEMKRHLERFYEQSIKQLEVFNQFESQLENDLNVHENHKQILDVLSLGIKQQELYCLWSKELIKKMIIVNGG
ncbi:PadR family transcriptional regulator [Clostridium sp. CF012]|uniref:PadR family transcriptional regulator n=1 Tax=Clostridium sp. CF012 TaxID=2843319 RepID=UPI001C0E7003|nr:PadR family transcriptional regulator [Clostridium sp. CF012]MBU3146928.1 PadR family transcriptional regulator [Clostridium sp. CF012]